MHKSLKTLVCILTCGLCLSNLLSLQAQDIKPDAYLTQDSIVIGEVIDYILKVEYPRDQQILFPDSSSNFKPFTYISRESFNTVSDSLMSKDSVVYKLTTFEADSIQSLEMPITVLKDNDSIKVFSNKVSLYFKSLLKKNKEVIAPISDTKILPSPHLFNKNLWFLIVGGIIILLIILMLIFIKPLIEYFKIRRLKKQYSNFASKYSSLLKKIEKDKLIAESALLSWKEYMEKLEKKPFTKLTSKEILKIPDKQAIKSSLHNIDQFIYGDFSEDIIKEYEKLRKHAEGAVNKVIKKIQNNNG